MPTDTTKKTKKTTTKKESASSSKAENQEFAVIETGGKQYTVSVGDSLSVEKLDGDFTEGDTIVFDKVLMVDNGSDTTIGTPYIEGASVEASFLKEAKGKKVEVIKYKAKSRYFKRRGHRQIHTDVIITSIK